MGLVIEVTFDGEVFRPTEKIDLKPDTEVTLTVIEIISDKPVKAIEFNDSLQIDGPSLS
jgi:predicted DNA-binding antitoxin AbrB/MazE fold protein